jgi:hypothetical protein
VDVTSSVTTDVDVLGDVTTSVTVTFAGVLDVEAVRISMINHLFTLWIGYKSLKFFKT